MPPPTRSHLCRHREKCLHLMASSGRYPHIDGDHRRMPIGCYKIGRIAGGENNKFLTNSVSTDPRHSEPPVGQRTRPGLFRGLQAPRRHDNPIGVFAMFAKHPISEENDVFLANLAEMTSRVIIEDKTANIIAQENAKLSAMISSMEEGVVFADADDLIVEVNDYMCRLLGKQREDIVGKRIE